MDLDSALTGKPAEGASAIDILRADHREVRRLFGEFVRVQGEPHAADVVVQTLCMQIELHDRVEREVFYPAAADVAGELVERALDAHDEISAAMEDLRSRADAGEPFAEAVFHLQALIERHVAFEEGELFPSLQSQADAVQKDIGCAIVKVKEELTRSTESFEGPAT